MISIIGSPAQFSQQLRGGGGGVSGQPGNNGSYAPAYIYSTSVFLQLFMPKVLVMYVLVLLGGLFYISQFPEKLFPGECRITVNCTACTVLVTIQSPQTNINYGVVLYTFISSGVHTVYSGYISRV